MDRIEEFIVVSDITVVAGYGLLKKLKGCEVEIESIYNDKKLEWCRPLSCMIYVNDYPVESAKRDKASILCYSISTAKL